MDSKWESKESMLLAHFDDKISTKKWLISSLTKA